MTSPSEGGFIALASIDSRAGAMERGEMKRTARWAIVELNWGRLIKESA